MRLIIVKVPDMRIAQVVGRGGYDRHDIAFRVDCGLKNAFAAMAEEQDISAAQMLRRLMRDAVEKHEESTAHERWQRRKDDIGHDVTDRLPVLWLPKARD